MKKVFLGLLGVGLVVYVGYGKFQDSQHRTKTHEIENSLFLSVVQGSPVKGFKCQPSFVNLTEKHIELFCENLPTEADQYREEIRVSTLKIMEQWAKDRPYHAYSHAVFFLDEKVLPGKK